MSTLLTIAPAVLIWIGSLYAMPQSIFLLAMLVTVATRGARLRRIRKIDIVCFFAITILSFLNFVYGSFFVIDSRFDRHPYFLAYGIVFLLAGCLKSNDLKIIAWLIGAECLSVLIEVYLGVNTLFFNHPEFRSDLNLEMLYYFRPFGLSDGVNSFGAKILAAIVICDYLIANSRAQNLLRMVLLIALVVNFSRSAIIAVAVHYAIFFLRKPGIKNILPLVAKLTVLTVFALWLMDFQDYFAFLRDQFNRGQDSDVDLSYRDVIWVAVLDFIAQNPLLGNSSSRFYVWLGVYGEWAHAHNSFLHLVSANGVFISSLMLGWLGININRQNIFLILPIIVFSIGQYGIFWGVSFLDIVFLFFVLHREERWHLRRSGSAKSWLHSRAEDKMAAIMESPHK